MNPSPSCYNIERLRMTMEAHQVDILIAATLENIQYFAGFRPVIKTLNRYHGECYVILDRRDLSSIHVVHSKGECDQLTESLTPLGHVCTYGTFYRDVTQDYLLDEDETRIHQWMSSTPDRTTASEALTLLLDRLAPPGKVHVAYDEDGMSTPARHALCRWKKTGKFTPCSSMIRHIRKVKTPYEIEQLTQSARANEASIIHVISQVHEGITERMLQSIFEAHLLTFGARPELTMLKIGRHAAGGQRQPSSRIHLRRGDLIWFDSDSTQNGFWADIARVYAFDTISTQQKDRHDCLREGMLRGATHIVPGMRARDVFDIMMQAVHSAGFPDYRRHHVGHGIGLEPYELPILSPDDDTLIEEDMVLSLETPYYAFGMGALHLEDPLLIKASGNSFLTQSPCNRLSATSR